MVSINEPDEPDELEGGNTPLCLDDLRRSELAEMVKVRKNSSNAIRSLVFTPP